MATARAFPWTVKYLYLVFLFVMFGSTTIGVAFLLLFSTLITFSDFESGERRLCSFSLAGLFAWIPMITLTLVFYSQAPHLCARAPC